MMFFTNFHACITNWKNFSIIWRRHHFRWRAANFDLCSAVMAIEQWGFFRVRHLLWHGSSVYKVHLRIPVTPTANAEHLAVKLCNSFEGHVRWYVNINHSDIGLQINENGRLSKKMCWLTILGDPWYSSLDCLIFLIEETS